MLSKAFQPRGTAPGWVAVAATVEWTLRAQLAREQESWRRGRLAEIRVELRRLADDAARRLDEVLRDASLEKTLDKAQLAIESEVDGRETDWREAYLSTPHGQPVALKD